VLLFLLATISRDRRAGFSGLRGKVAAISRARSPKASAIGRKSSRK
jgi:hypothetical protein